MNKIHFRALFTVIGFWASILALLTMFYIAPPQILRIFMQFLGGLVFLACVMGVTNLIYHSVAMAYPKAKKD